MALPNANGDSETSNSAKQRENNIHAKQTRSYSPTTSQVNIPDVSPFRRPFKNKGLSEEAQSIIISSWRQSTRKQYVPYIKKWQRYCSQRKLDPFSTTVENGVNFLAELYREGIGYSALNTARSALSTTCMLKNSETFGTHPLVSRFMKGVFESRPSLPRYSETWDVNVVLKYLSNLGQPEEQTLKMLTYKTAMLLALLTGQRRQTLHAFDVTAMQLNPEKCVFVIKTLLKTSRPGKHLSSVEFQSYKEDRTLCPVSHIAEYVKRTASLRGTQHGFFISYRKPHKEVSVDTMSRWLKTTLQLAGIDIAKFGAHSTRSASTSAAKSMKMPIDLIMQSAGWTQESTFVKFYLKPVVSQENFGNIVLHNTQ